MFNRKRDGFADLLHDGSLLVCGVLVRGNVHFHGMLHVEGRIEGDAHAIDEAAAFVLGKQSAVVGKMRVPHAHIDGSVHGDIQAVEQLKLGATTRMTRDVHYHILEMALGTQVNGNVCHVATTPSLEPPPGIPVSETSIGKQVSPSGMCAGHAHD